MLPKWSDSASSFLSDYVSVGPIGTGFRMGVYRDGSGSGGSSIPYHYFDLSSTSTDTFGTQISNTRLSSIAKGGEWSHVAITSDSSNLKLFVNGALMSSCALSGSSCVDTSGLVTDVPKSTTTQYSWRLISRESVSAGAFPTSSDVLEFNPTHGTASKFSIANQVRTMSVYINLMRFIFFLGCKPSGLFF